MPRQPNAAFMKPVQPDAILAEIVGDYPMARSTITSKLWEYIRNHNRQDATNRRQVNADDVLRPFFDGRDSVSIFELPKCVKAHVTKVEG